MVVRRAGGTRDEGGREGGRREGGREGGREPEQRRVTS